VETTDDDPSAILTDIFSAIDRNRASRPPAVETTDPVVPDTGAAARVSDTLLILPD
jgi:hypothetical protein